MNKFLYILGAIIFLALAGCASAPTPTPLPPPTALPPTATVAPSATAQPTATRVPSTNTPVPPTATLAPTSTATPKPIAIKIFQHPTLGRILVDGDGRTLYLFTNDNKGASTCSGNCANLWPPFLSSTKASAQEGANAALISISPRQDGALQATYNGWALYYRAGDAKPGDTNGQGQGGVWFVLNPAGDPVKPASGGDGGYSDKY